MKKLIYTLSCLFLMFCLSAQNPGSSSSPIKTEWLTFSEPAYQIKYPANWTLDRSGVMGSKFILFAPLESSTDPFKENVNLQITDLGAPNVITLDIFADAAKDQITKFITDAKILRSGRVGKGGAQEYYEIEFTGKQGTLSLHWNQRYLLRGRYVYILTCTAEVASYDAYQEMAKTILGSFALSK